MKNLKPEPSLSQGSVRAVVDTVTAISYSYDPHRCQQTCNNVEHYCAFMSRILRFAIPEGFASRPRGKAPPHTSIHTHSFQHFPRSRFHFRLFQKRKFHFDNDDDDENEDDDERKRSITKLRGTKLSTQHFPVNKQMKFTVLKWLNG